MLGYKNVHDRCPPQRGVSFCCLLSLLRLPHNWTPETTKDLGPFLVLFSGDELRSIATKVPLRPSLEFSRRLKEFEGERKCGQSYPAGFASVCGSGRFFFAAKTLDVSSFILSCPEFKGVRWELTEL